MEKEKLSRIPEWKKKAVLELKDDLEKFNTISIVNLEMQPYGEVTANG